MPLSWNEIKDRALAFSREWADESREQSEAKSFWDGFFHIFGISRRRVASFEAPVKRAEGAGGFIDLLWKGVLLVEHKSRGKDLDRAYRQAIDYFPGLKERDLPRYVLVSDFARFRLYDLDPPSPSGRGAGGEGEYQEFSLADLHRNVRLFGFIAGYQTRSFGQEDPVNVIAAERLGRLHDQLRDAGYTDHPLEVLLVRLLFCLFAEDTAIFERRQFQEYLEQRTGEDGADLGMHLAQLFQVLDTPAERRQKSLDEQLAGFPYVNGQLFREPLPIAACNRAMRETLLDACALDWSRISPAIFGSLFQSIMQPKERRNLGAHYTTETNILKALRPLFLDELRAEFERIRRQPKRLVEFHQRLGKIRLLDPACGCGNFLVIAYRELRLLELELLRELYRHRTSGFLDVGGILLVDVDQFHGIEIEEFPAQIAQVALWLTDHQMNLRVSEEFGQYFVRLPLKKTPHIVQGNALALEWREVVRPEELSYIVGNPPFVGKKEQSAAQKAEVVSIFRDVKGAGVLDYVSCWYRKAVEYMAAAQPPAGLEPAGGLPLRTAFVSTNSITQGEQVGVLWPDLFRRGVKIHFAHRTFQWTSEARGKAAVHCVIIGFGLHDAAEKWIFEYETPKSEPHAVPAANINPYLVDGADIVVESRTRPLCAVPEMKKGNEATDDGHLSLNADQRDELTRTEPRAAAWIRKLIGSDEFLNGGKRWCLWLEGIAPEELRSLPAIIQRVERVRDFRRGSPKAATVAKAATAWLFGENRQPAAGKFLVVPKVSSERRVYVPMDYFDHDVIVNNTVQFIESANLYLFGVLHSTMHMSWMRAVGGRMKSDYQYSIKLVYNNFPWPDPTERQREAIEAAAQAVLDARARFPQSTLADLYDPLTMPPELLKTHRALDRAVDAAYGMKGFATEAERVAFLFEHYRQLTSLIPAEPAPAAPRRRKPAS